MYQILSLSFAHVFGLRKLFKNSVSKDKKKKKPGLEQMFFGARRRLTASKIFFSKQLEEKRLETIEAGASPWKILRYQRISNPEEIPFPLNAHSYVTPELFDVHMKYLSRNCNVVPMTKLIKMIENYEEIPSRTVALSFDGGFSDTLVNATPILIKYGLPSAHFVPTGYIESGSFLLDDKILMSLIVHIMNDIEIPNFDFIDPELLDSLSPERNKKTLNQQALSDFVAMARALEETDRREVATALLNSSSRFSSLPEYEDFVSWEELETLQERLSIEIGSMGHFLVSKPKSSPEDALSDIELSMNTLNDRGLDALGLLAIPEGMEVPYAASLLGNTNFRYLLLNETFPEPRFQTKIPMLLGRISMSQLNAYCLEVFACRLFELSYGSLNY